MTTLNYQVGQSADDGYEKVDTTIDITGLTIGIMSSPNQWALARFAGVAVPQGAGGDIQSALVSFYVFSTSNDDLVADIYGEAADNAAAISTTNGNISGRSLTASKTSVNATAIAAGGAVWYEIDVTAQAREIAGRTGWASGNAMAFIVDALSGIGFNPRSWDYGSGLGPKLTIVYEPAGDGAEVLVIGSGIMIF
ncbi:MAG: hypothetical protein R3C43_19225 [Chloroflexota bacterium]